MWRKIVVIGLIVLAIPTVGLFSSYSWRSVSYELVKVADYAEEDIMRKALWKNRDDEPFTQLDIVMTQERLDEIIEWHGLTCTDSFDFKNYCLLIAYGRKIVDLKRIYQVNSHLKATFGEYAGAKVFFYKLERHSYMPTDFYLEHFIMEDGKRVPIKL